MSLSALHQQAFYGATTIGEKGQVVIPSDARVKLGLKKGQKLLVFGSGHGMIALVKLEHLARFEDHLKKHLKTIRLAAKSAR